MMEAHRRVCMILFAASFFSAWCRAATADVYMHCERGVCHFASAPSELAHQHTPSGRAQKTAGAANQKVGQIRRGSTAALDAQRGFRKLTFGAPISTCEGLILTQDNGDTKWYARSDDDLTLGKSKLKAISYRFDKGVLVEIVFFASGAANSHALLDYVRTAYGEGRPDTQRNAYGWAGRLVKAYYEQVPGTQDAKFYMWSVAATPPAPTPVPPISGPPGTPTPLTIKGLLPDALFLTGPNGPIDITGSRRPTPPRAQDRRAAYLRAHPELSEGIRQAIAAGRPLVGMSTEDMLACCGPPIDETHSESSEGHVERWQYGESGFAYGFMLYSQKLDPTDLHAFCFFTFVDDRLVVWECPE